MTFKLRDGLVVGDQTVIDSNAKVTAQDLYYDGEFPSIRPVLHYNFTRPATFPKGSWPTNPLQFNRASRATYIGVNGLIQTAAVNEPRFYYDPLTAECKGIILEREYTNCVLYSEKFTDASWTKTNVTVSDNQVTSPDGTTTAASISLSSANGFISSLDSTGNTGKLRPICATIYVKANTTNKVKLKLYNIVNSNEFGVLVTFNLSGSGSIESVTNIDYDNTTQLYDVSLDNRVSITKLINGWFKCDVHMLTYNGNKTITSTSMAIYPVDVSGLSGLYIWGAMFTDLYTAPLNYIKTNGAIVSNATEELKLNIINNTDYPGVTSSWYNNAEWTVAYEAMPTVVRHRNGESSWFAGYSGATGSTGFSVSIPSIASHNDLGSTAIITNGYNYASNYPSIGNEVQAYTFNKFALAIDNSSPYYCLNGVNYAFPSFLDTQGAVTNIYPGIPVINSFKFGKNNALTTTTCVFKWFSYYNKKLSDVETLELTK